MTPAPENPVTSPAAVAPEALFFNPFDPAFREDPYAVYARLREQDPVHQSPLGIWVLSRYADCASILRDPRASSDARNSDQYKAFEQQAALDPDAQLFAETRPFLFMDPPDHTRLRRLVSKAFTPRVVERLRPRVEAIVGELLDGVAERGEMDVIANLAYPLPVTVISEMLGVPPEDHERFKQWSSELAHSLDPQMTPNPELMQRQQAAADAFRDYFRGLLAERRAEPRDDLLSALVQADEAGDTLTEEELLTTCILLLIAGHETTVNLIGNGLLALLRWPDEQRRLRDDPSLARSAVEELLRYDPPVQMTVRTALDDIAVGGHTIEKGVQAVVLLGSASRDPAEFAEPDRLDITRAENRHIAFGLGIHFCLGAPLARVEGEIALREVLSRFAGLELAAERPVYKPNIVLRGLESLPVRFDARV